MLRVVSLPPTISRIKFPMNSCWSMCAHRVGMDHHADQVGRRLLADLARPQPPEILAAFVHVAEPFLALLGILADLDVAGPVGPEGQLAPVRPRKVEQDRQHLRGQFDRDLVDPVELLTPRQAVEDFGGALADVAAHPHHFAGREGGGDGAALAGVDRAVAGDEHRHPHRIFVDHVGDGDALRLRREDFGQRFDVDDRLVGADRPIGAELAVGGVVDRIGAAQLGERRAPGVLAEQLGPADIERIGRHFLACQGRHRSPLLRLRSET